MLAVFSYAASYRIGNAQTNWRKSSPCSMPSSSEDCQVGTAINTSSSIQTKSGLLTFTDGLTVSNPQAHKCDIDHSVSCSVDADCVNEGAGFSCIDPAQINVGGSIKWTNTDAEPDEIKELTSWYTGTAGGEFVDLFSTKEHAVREGYMSVRNSDAQPGKNTSAIYAVAAAPTVQHPSYAVKASGNASGYPSWAIRAKSGINDSKSTALRALSPLNARNAWAAYFQGNVSVMSPFSVVMGGAGGIDSDVSGSLCLGGFTEVINGTLTSHPRVCYSSWPKEAVGDDQWFDTGTYLQIKNTSLNVALGGWEDDDPHRVFYLTARPNSRADIFLRGDGASYTMTVE